MSASFPLTLDTHAPQVTWGDPTGTQPGEVLHVPYTLDEPGLLSATIKLRDGRELPMVVGASELTVEIPLDNVAGDAEVAAAVRDDVWNEATARMTVRLEGVVLPEPSPPPEGSPVGGMGTDRRQGPTRRLVEIRSRARASSQRKIRIQGHVRSTAVARSARTIERRPADRPQPAPVPSPAPSRVTLRRYATAHASTSRVITVRATTRARATASSTRSIRRRDDELAALVVLDVL